MKEKKKEESEMKEQELLEALKNLKEAVENTTKGKYKPEVLDALDEAQSIIDLVEKGK